MAYRFDPFHRIVGVSWGGSLDPFHYTANRDGDGMPTQPFIHFGILVNLTAIGTYADDPDSRPYQGGLEGHRVSSISGRIVNPDYFNADPEAPDPDPNPPGPEDEIFSFTVVGQAQVDYAGGKLRIYEDLETEGLGPLMVEYTLSSAGNVEETSPEVSGLLYWITFYAWGGPPLPGSVNTLHQKLVAHILLPGEEEPTG